MLLEICMTSRLAFSRILWYGYYVFMLALFYLALKTTSRRFAGFLLACLMRLWYVSHRRPAKAQAVSTHDVWK